MHAVCGYNGKFKFDPHPVEDDPRRGLVKPERWGVLMPVSEEVRPVGDAAMTYDVSYSLNGPIVKKIPAAGFTTWARKNGVVLGDFGSVLEGLRRFTGDLKIRDWEMNDVAPVGDDLDDDEPNIYFCVTKDGVRHDIEALTAHHANLIAEKRYGHANIAIAPQASLKSKAVAPVGDAWKPALSPDYKVARKDWEDAVKARNAAATAWRKSKSEVDWTRAQELGRKADTLYAVLRGTSMSGDAASVGDAVGEHVVIEAGWGGRGGTAGQDFRRLSKDTHGVVTDDVGDDVWVKLDDSPYKWKFQKRAIKNGVEPVGDEEEPDERYGNQPQYRGPDYKTDSRFWKKGQSVTGPNGEKGTVVWAASFGTKIQKSDGGAVTVNEGIRGHGWHAADSVKPVGDYVDPRAKGVRAKDSFPRGNMRWRENKRTGAWEWFSPATNGVYGAVVTIGIKDPQIWANTFGPQKKKSRVSSIAAGKAWIEQNTAQTTDGALSKKAFAYPEWFVTVECTSNKTGVKKGTKRQYIQHAANPEQALKLTVENQVYPEFWRGVSVRAVDGGKATDANLVTMRPQAVIKQIPMDAEFSPGKWNCRITLAGKFQSSTVHPTKEAAVEFAAKKKATDGALSNTALLLAALWAWYRQRMDEPAQQPRNWDLNSYVPRRRAFDAVDPEREKRIRATWKDFTAPVPNSKTRIGQPAL
jgi:hypothetical protein